MANQKVHLTLAVAMSTILVLTASYKNVKSISYSDACLAANAAAVLLLVLVVFVSGCCRTPELSAKKKHGCDIAWSVISAIGLVVALIFNCISLDKIRESERDSYERIQRVLEYLARDFSRVQSARGLSEEELFLYGLVLLDVIGVLFMLITIVEVAKKISKAQQEQEAQQVVELSQMRGNTPSLQNP